MLALAIVAGLAPYVVPARPLLHQIADRVLAAYEIEFRCETVRWGWFRPIELDNISLASKSTACQVTCAKVRLDRPLLQLIRHPDQFGEVVITAPRLDIEVRPGGSSLEDMLAKLPTSSGQKKWPQGRIRVVDGQIRITSSALRRHWTIEACQADVLLTPDAVCEGQVAARSIGPVTASTHWPLTDPSASRSAQLAFDSFDLQTFAALLHRFERSEQLAGIANGTLTIVSQNGDGTHGEWQIDGHVELPQARFSSELIAESELAFDGTRCDIRGRSAGQDMIVDRLEIATPFGSASLSGRLPRAPITLNLDGIRQPLSHPAEASLAIDLSRLTHALPETFQLQEGVQIESGVVQADLRSSPVGEQVELSGQLSMSNLRAQSPQGLIDWPDPIRISFASVIHATGFEIRQLQGQSEFATIEGSGSTNHGRIVVRSDFSKLAEQLARFQRSDAAHLAGSVATQVAWQQSSDASTSLEMLIESDNLQLSLGPDTAWTEPRIVAHLSGTVHPRDQAKWEVHDGRCHVTLGTDQLQVALTDGVLFDGRIVPVLPVRITTSGQLASWQRRLAVLRPELSVRAQQGDFELTADATISPPARLSVNNLDSRFRQLDLELSGRRILEPAATLKANAEIDWVAHRLAAPDVEVATTSFSARAKDMMMSWDPNTSGLRGVVSYRGDLAKLWSWTGDTDRRAAGELTGHLRIDRQSEGLSFETNNRIQRFAWFNRQLSPARPNATVATDHWLTIWQEPELQLMANGVVDTNTDHLSLTSAEITSPTIQMRASGSCANLRSTCDIALKGESRYDLNVLSHQLRLGEASGIRLTGQMTSPFELDGPLRSPGTALADSDVTTQYVTSDGVPPRPLVSPQLSARMTSGWQSADVWGFRLGEASFETELARQVLQLRPTKIPMSGGTVTAGAQIHLDARRLLEIQPGRVAEQIQITPEMTQGWLKYVAPLLANATRAEGQFSADIDRFTVPLDDPHHANASGRLSIHSGRVGPGPLAQQILDVVQKIRMVADPKRATEDVSSWSRWVELPEQSVPFRLEQQRVIHESFVMQVADTPVRTSGWVGLDQRLSMVAQVPIQDSWIGDNRWLASMRGQSLQIPISGSLDRPRIDDRVLQNLSRQTLTGAAENLLQNEVERQLQRLFKGK